MSEQTSKHQGAINTINELGLKKAKGGKKANLPEVLDQDIEDSAGVALLLERTLELKTKADDTVQALTECKEELAAIAASNGLEGLRTGRVVFTQQLQDGRTTVDPSKLYEALLARGVTADVIKECIKLATKQGDSFWVRRIESI